MSARNSLLFIVLLASLTLVGCGDDNSSISQATDYSQAAHWLAAPSSPDKNVDVFYVYPTAYKKVAPSDPDFCTIDNASMVQGAQAAFQRQATAFAPSANIYAPYYRQVDATYQLALPIAQQDENIRKEPGTDVTAATSVVGTNPVTQPGGIAINPITWTTEEVTATAAQNLGSIQLNPATGGTPVLDEYGEIMRVMGLADARVDKVKGVVICSTVNPADYNVGFPLGVYHTFDYAFYFFNVRQNAADRIQYYFAGKNWN